MHESGNSGVRIRLALVVLVVASLLGLAMPVSAGGGPTPVPGALPTTVSPAVATPTQAPAAEATATAVSEALALDFVSVTSPVTRGNNATAVVRTAPGAECTITVTYASGPSEAAGLVPKTAGADGLVSWTWLVGGNTTPGTWPITVTSREGGREATATASITVEAATASGLQAPGPAEAGVTPIAWVVNGLARIGDWLAGVF